MAHSPVDAVFHQAMQLDPKDRAHLVERLLDEADETLDLNSSDWETGWLTELMARREERLKHGDDYLLDADEAISEIRATLPPRVSE